MKYKITVGENEREIRWERERPASFEIDGESFSVDIQEIVPGTHSVIISGKQYTVHISNGGKDGNGDEFTAESGFRRYAVTVEDPRKLKRGSRGRAAADGRHNVKSQMPGKVVRVLVAEGDAVEMGRGLIVVEAMKMQNEIKSPKSGKVVKLAVQLGQAVNAGDLLLSIE